MSDLISRQEALEELEDWERCYTWDEHCRESNEDYIVSPSKVIAKLPSAQPEESNCEYCREDGEGYVTPLEKNGHAFVRFGVDGWELSLKANGWHGRAKIKFCPMCGRKLTDG